MKYLIIFSFVALSLNTSAQCCPYINVIEVIPANPTPTDNVKIVTTATTPNQGMFLNSSFFIGGSTILINACYYNGGLTATQTYIDTLTIGTLPEGTYNVHFTAIISSDTASCSAVDSTSSNMNFTVQDGISGLPSISNDIARVYPNPSTGIFNVDFVDPFINHVVIRSISGKIVYRGEAKSAFNLNMDDGVYIIEFRENERILGYQRLIVH